jgi:ApaG protein|tara:strand:- start:15320 stop:15697 length:378 start_codon:yes stop_codon:yes gene_type:complete
MSEQHNITVDVTSTHIKEQSDANAERYVFTYTVTIHNEGLMAAQLLSRHWIITNADGKTQEVRGDGVVGEQPNLNPGDSFQYTSGTMLETPVGSMQGSYQMQADDGTTFDAEIKPFTLSVPNALH